MRTMSRGLEKDKKKREVWKLCFDKLNMMGDKNTVV